MKSISLTLFVWLCAIIVYSQVNIQEHYNSAGIIITSQDATCNFGGEDNTMDYKFIKLENRTAQKARVSFHLEIFYNGACAGCDGSPEYQSMFVLEPHSQVQGNCTGSLPGRLDVLVRNPNLATLVFGHFNVVGVTVQWID